MSRLTLSPFGLLIAGTMSTMTVFMEVARKKAVSDRPLMATTCCCHVFDSLVFAMALAVKISTGTALVVRDGGSLFGIAGIALSAPATYLVYQTINVALLSVATFLFRPAGLSDVAVRPFSGLHVPPSHSDGLPSIGRVAAAGQAAGGDPGRGRVVADAPPAVRIGLDGSRQGHFARERAAATC